MAKDKIREFLTRLTGDEGCQFGLVEWRCEGNEYIYSRKTLNLMNISKDEQENFLDLCHEFGGHCDCEILMNAASSFMGEETPW